MHTNHSQGISRILAISAVSVLVGFAAHTSVAQLLMPAVDADTPPALPDQEQPEVLSRGPVHEAFAEPVNLEYQTGLIAPERPPPNIEEVPPNERPQGQQYAWIPGYWSWDADRRGYIWVSACWRVAPPRMSWVPGYWAQVPDGWEWVPGFWTPAGVEEIEYLPAPPTAGDMEPYGSAPSPDTIWVPPCMYWVQGQYVRRAGYWLEARSDWVWVPTHYVPTPRGYIFAAGHWDYAFERRGVLFAPVYFSPRVYGRMNFSFSPSIVIDVGLLRLNLFAYPRYSHYYFGDYYDDAYVSIGIFPWFGSHRSRTWYDPVYQHTRWSRHRTEPRWEEHGREDYHRRRNDKNLRPPRTYREQEDRVARLPEAERGNMRVTQPLASVAARREAPIKLERITDEKRQNIKKQATAVQTFRNERNRWESTTASERKTPGTISERKENTVQPIAEPRERRQPTQEGKAGVKPPISEPRVTVPPKEQKDVTPRPTPREPVVTPRPTPREPVVTPRPTPREPVVTPRPTPPREPVVTPRPTPREPVVTPRPTPREPVVTPPRESRTPQPERVQIPKSPIVGQSGRSGIIFQKGPPSQPASERRGKDGGDLSRGRGSR